MKTSYGASFQPQSTTVRHTHTHTHTYTHTYTHTHTHTNCHKNHCHSEKLILYESVIYFKMEKIDIHCFSITLINPNVGCSGSSDGKKICLQCGRPGFEPWFGMIPSRREEQSALPGGSTGKESTCSAGDLGLISGLGRSPVEGDGYPLQYSGLQNSTDRGAWSLQPWCCRVTHAWETTFSLPLSILMYYIQHKNNIIFEFFSKYTVEKLHRCGNI